MMGPQEDYIETVFTCEGDYDDPHLQDRLDQFHKSLKDLLLTDQKKLILKKVEPWNSVRVTFNIPRDAATRLKQLAQQGNSTLRELGVLAVQIQDQNISLTIAGRNNECTQLVFRTANTPASSSVSIFETNSPSLDVLGPHGPGPSHVEATSRNIAEYLKGVQGESLINSLFNQAPTDHSVFPPNLTNVGGPNSKINNLTSEHSGEFQRSSQQSGHHPSQYGNQTHTMPSVSSPSPSRSPSRHGGLKFPQLPGMHPGMPPGGPRHNLDNLPPPPPYPHGSSIMNHLQNIRFGAPGTSPLLTNLLQNDPNLSSLLAAGRLPASLEAEPPKKKRKPRKKKPKPETEIPLTSGLNQMHSGPHIGLPTVASLPSSSRHTNTLVNNSGIPQSVQDQHRLFNVQAMHNTNIQNKAELNTLPHPHSLMKKSEETDTAGKIINPVTGLLEPMDNLSDTSPTKSDNGKSSPRFVGQKTAGDVLPKNQIKSEHYLVGHQGRPMTMHSDIQKHGPSNIPPGVMLTGKPLKPNSSQIGKNASSDFKIEDYLKNEIMHPSHMKNDIISRKVEQHIASTTAVNVHHHSQTLDTKCNTNTSASRLNVTHTEMANISAITQKMETNKLHIKQDKLPQESDVKSMTPQLLNKPLLQVKQIVGGKPSGSPDSNGDSECSTQSMTLDTHNGADSGSQSTTHRESQCHYNNDSGVGSSSERSEDTPSELGDTSDYKSGPTNSFDCAKTQIIDSLKQTPPSSKSVTVGYAVADTHKDLKNNKPPSAYLGIDKLLNAKFDPTKLNAIKTDKCSPSQAQMLNLAADEIHRANNNVELHLKQVPNEISVNRKAHKLNVPVSNELQSSKEDGKHNPMQGNPEPSMHKKKSSPRNSPRGSPRTVGSPRNTVSPRGNMSPRATDTSRQSFHTPVEFGNHSSLCESRSKSPFKDTGKSHNEQRKSPFNILQTSHSNTVGLNSKSFIGGGSHLSSSDGHRDYHQGGVESNVRMTPQYNMDNIALLKSLEAQAAYPQFSALAGSKDTNNFLLEELRPFLQKLHQHSAHASMVSSPMSNGTDIFNHTTRQPGPGPHSGNLSKSLGPHPSLSDLHNALEIATLRNNIHPSLNTPSSVTVSVPGDRDHASSNCVNAKGNNIKNSPEETKGSNSGSSSRRSSPGAATGNSHPYNPCDSSLPPPKRLTESVQKLFPLPLLDNSLPHVNRKSPSSCASVTRSSINSTVSPPSTHQRGITLSSSSNKTSLAELPHFDLDSITPTITSLGNGPIDFSSVTDTSIKSQTDTGVPELVTMPTLPLMESDLPHLTCQNPVSTTASTKVIPVLSGSIPSHKTFKGDYSLGSSDTVKSALGDVPVNSVPNSANHITTVCNSDYKMASNSATTVETWTDNDSSRVLEPPVLHPQTVRYPVQKQHVEKPKSPYQQMGLSEMLQETAKAGQSSPMSKTVLQKSQEFHSQNLKSTELEKKGSHVKMFVEKLQKSIDHQQRSTTSSSESKQSSNCDSMKKTLADSLSDNIDIPKLKRQTSLVTSSSNSCVVNSETTSSGSNSVPSLVEHLSSNNRVPDHLSTNSPVNLTPPVLTAVSQFSNTSTSKAPETLVECSDSTNSFESSVPVSVNTKVHEPSVSVSLKESVPELIEPKQKTVQTLEDITSEMQAKALDNLQTETQIVNKTPVLSKTINPSNEPLMNSIVTKSLRKRRESSESLEDRGEDHNPGSRQLRSRKRTNTGDSDSSNMAEEAKKFKLDLHAETSDKSDNGKETKHVLGAKPVGSTNVTTVPDIKQSNESPAQADSIKSGLRTRTNVKNIPVSGSQEEKDKSNKPPSGRDTRKDVKTAAGKTITDKKVEMSKQEDVRRNQQGRRNRQSPSVDKPAAPVVAREKSPLRVSRTRGRNSPVVMETNEDSQENKRTTRSAKTKVEPAASKSTVNANKRRRTSQDHR